MQIGTSYFVSFTKACDYYRDQGNDELTPAELERLVRDKIASDEIQIGIPPVKVGERLLLIDNGTRYALEWDESPHKPVCVGCGRPANLCAWEVQDFENK